MSDSLLKKNNVSIHGFGSKIMIFSHGYGCSKSMWRLIAPSFFDTHKVVLLDLVGSGDSDTAVYDFNKYSTLEAYADDIIELCDSQKWSSVVFVGHSVSSMIGVLFAKKRPDLISELIMIGPSPCYINKESYEGGFAESDIHDLLDSMDSNYLGWSSFITPVIMNNPDRPELSEELKNSFCRTEPAIAKHFGRVTFLSDNREDLKLVHAKSLIIQSEVDSIAPIVVGTYISENMSNAQFSLIDTVGHCPHLSHPEKTIEAMKSFLFS
jgi:sigma-B regulation protein RsbQ